MTEPKKQLLGWWHGQYWEVGLSGEDMDALRPFPILYLMPFFHLALPELYLFSFSQNIYIKFFFFLNQSIVDVQYFMLQVT